MAYDAPQTGIVLYSPPRILLFMVCVVRFVDQSENIRPKFQIASDICYLYIALLLCNYFLNRKTHSFCFQDFVLIPM